MSQKILLPLIVKAVAGDREAFEQILVLQNSLILWIIRRNIDCPHDTEDIRQEVAIRIYENISSLRKPEAFGSWLRTLVNNECYRFIEWRKNGLEHENIEELKKSDSCSVFFIETDTDSIPFAYVEKLEFATEFESAMKSLPGPGRTLFHMRYAQDMCCQDIADSTGMKAGTVSVTLHRAKEKLRKKLSGRSISGAR